MKRVLLSTAVISTLFFTGCTNQPNQANQQAGQVYVDPELQGAPSWVMMPMVEGTIAEVGSGKRNVAGDMSFQRNEAMADARDNLARLISTKVKNMFKSFKSSTGTGDTATFDKAAESVSKQIASQTLNGTMVKDTWISRSGTLYVLMAVNSDAVADMMEKTLKSNSSFKNDQALYQKFLASKAQGELDAELEKAEK